MTIRELIDEKIDIDLQLTIGGQPVTCACKQDGALALEVYPAEWSPAE